MDFIASLHPKFVHFPIALFLSYTLLEIIGIAFKKESFNKAAYMILLLSLLGAVAAVLTGDQASQAADKLSDLLDNSSVSIPLGAIERHEDFANFSMWYIVALAVIRTYLVIKKKFTGWLKYSFIVLSLIGSIIIFETALLGGKLVYQHGVGTDLIKPENVQIK